MLLILMYGLPLAIYPFLSLFFDHRFSVMSHSIFIFFCKQFILICPFYIGTVLEDTVWIASKVMSV